MKQSSNTGAAKSANTQDYAIYAHVFDAVLEQRIAPGTRLSEESLGEIFGVSRTTVRRALARLDHEQVILLRPNRGAVVATPTPEDVAQIFHARRLVERAITELAVQHATAADVMRLRQTIADEQACLARGERGAAIRLSGEFHLVLAEVAQNQPLLGFQRSLVSQCSLAVALYDRGQSSHCSFDEHGALVNAIEARDTEQAVTLMMHHLDHIQDKLDFAPVGQAEDLKAVFANVKANRPS
ncbi:MAG: GntR family transcriptional regulator [Natronospirillum sp.]